MHDGSRVLKQEERDRRVRDSRAFIRRVKREGDMFLQRIITTDEKWLYNSRDQGAVCGMEAKRFATPCKGQGNKERRQDDVHHVCGHPGHDPTLNAGYYSKVLRRDLVDALRKKRQGIPVEHFLLHNDNASSNTAAATQLKIGVIGFGSVQHPPYSPDLAQFDFAIFPSIKRQLKGQRFDSLTELCRTTSAIVKNYDCSWYEEIFRQWVHRHRRCIGCNGAYFEEL